MKYDVNLYDANDNLIYNEVIEANSKEQAIEFAWDDFLMDAYAKAKKIGDNEYENDL